MTSVDELPTPFGDSEGASGGDDPTPSPYSDDFVAEIRELLDRELSGGLFNRTAGDAAQDAAAGEELVAEEEVVTEGDLGAEADDAASEDGLGSTKQAGPPLIFPGPTNEPADADRAGPIHLFLPRTEPEERPTPSLSGLAVPVANEDHELMRGPDLFISSGGGRADVAFVPAQEEGPNRYRWVLLIIGLLAIVGAVWLTWLAQSSDTVDAPITTAELVTTTEAPAPSTTASSTTAPSTASSITSAPSTSATSTTVPTSAAPLATPRPTTPRRPATTAAPATTAVPETSENITVPELTLPPPIAVPTTAASTTAAPPPTPPPDPPAEG